MREVNPDNTSRAKAFRMWMQSPMPMVTLLKRLNVRRLVRLARRKNLKFNMLMCYCIGRAASRIPEFLLLPQNNKLFQYDKLAVNIVVTTASGEISTCDVPFSDDIKQFNEDYLRLTQQVYDSGEAYELGCEYSIIGTSALSQYFIDGAVNQYSGIYNNPFMAWGRYRKCWLKVELPVSFQFHHAQMDGAQAAEFLERLQAEIDTVKL